MFQKVESATPSELMMVFMSVLSLEQVVLGVATQESGVRRDERN